MNLFNTKYENKQMREEKIEYLYKLSKEKKLDLNPKYQRGKVWLDEHKTGLIDSIITGILINPIIFNYDSKKDVYICMDGKQRISTIIDFINNEISYNNSGLSYYFSEIMIKNKKINATILTKEEQIKFLKNAVVIFIYKDLHIKYQIDVFYRINEGIKISDEHISKIIIELGYVETPNNEINNNYIDLDKKTSLNLFCENLELKNLLKPFCNVYKDEYKTFLLRLICILTTKELTIPRTCKTLNDYFKKTKINLNKIETKIKHYFSNNIFGSNRLPRLCMCSILTGIYYFEKKNFNNNFEKMISMIRQVHEISEFDNNINNASLDVFYDIYSSCQQ